MTAHAPDGESEGGFVAVSKRSQILEGSGSQLGACDGGEKKANAKKGCGQSPEEPRHAQNVVMKCSKSAIPHKRVESDVFSGHLL